MIKHIAFGKNRNGDIFGKQLDEKYTFPVAVNGLNGGLNIISDKQYVYLNIEIIGNPESSSIKFDKSDFNQIIHLWQDTINTDCKLMVETEEIIMILKKINNRNLLYSYQYYNLSIMSRDRNKICIDIDEDIIQKIIKIGRWL